jgi:hypothetical protein
MQRVGKTDECKKAKMSRNVPLTRPFTKVSGRKEWLAADGLWRETSVRGNGTAKEAKVDEAQMDCRWAWASQPASKTRAAWRSSIWDSGMQGSSVDPLSQPGKRR